MRPVDHYAVLGLSPDASDDEVKRAYRSLSRRYHPDTAEGSDAANTEEFIRITRAYHAIVDGEDTTLPAVPAAVVVRPSFSKERPRRRLFGPRLPLRAVLGLLLLAGALVAGCLVISEVYSRRVMLSTLHDGGVAFVPPKAQKTVREEPAALTFAEKLRREREAEAAAAKKDNGGEKIVAVASSRPDPTASSRPTPVASAQPTPTQSSRPTPAVISTAGRDLKPATEQPLQGKARFLADARNDREGASAQPTPTQPSRPTPAVISTAGRDLKPATEHPPQEKARFLASRRNDSGGGLTPVALPGTPRILADARNDIGEKRNDREGASSQSSSDTVQPTPAVAARPTPAASTQPSSVASAQPTPTPSSRPTPAVISTAGRDLKPATEHPPQEKARFLASRRKDSGGGLTPVALPGTPRILADTRNDIGEKRNDREGASSQSSSDTVQPTPAVAAQPTPAASTQPSPTPSSRPTPAVISTAGRDLKPATEKSQATKATPVIKPVPATNTTPILAATKPPSAPAQPPPTEAQLQQQLNRFLTAYCQAYGARNLTKFQQFFTTKATENGTPVSDLMPTYSKLFASTEALTLKISTLKWQQPTDGQIALNGRFTIDLKYKNAEDVHGAGKIDFLLAHDATTFQIQKMTYSFDQ